MATECHYGKFEFFRDVTQWKKEALPVRKRSVRFFKASVGGLFL